MLEHNWHANFVWEELEKLCEYALQKAENLGVHLFPVLSKGWGKKVIIFNILLKSFLPT